MINRIISKMFVFIIFMLASGLIFASQLQTIQSANTQACSFILSTDDWRVLSLISLLISSVFVAAMYLYGSVLDSSFIGKAKNEFFQIIFTGIILIFFVFIVQLMCSNLISEIFNINESPYVASYQYLDNLSTFIRNQAYIIGGAATALSFLSSVEIGGKQISGTNYGTTSTLFSFLSDPVSYFGDSLFMIFGSLMLAYVTTISQINILAIVPYLTLIFLIPAGIVLRSLYPFRKFGGALLGLGIGLYIFIPIVLLFNSLLISNYISSNNVDLSLHCSDNSDCYSHICAYSPQIGFNVCQPLKNASQTCTQDLECKSQKCMNGICVDCGGEGSINPICCKGYVRNQTTQKCELALPNGQQCNSNDQCISGICDVKDGTKQCIPKKLIGEQCNSDEECVSHSCVGIAPNKKCKQTLLSDEDRQIVLSEYAIYTTYSSSEKEMFEVITSGASTITGIVSDQDISQSIQSQVSLNPQSKSMGFFYEKLIAPVVIVFIAGVLLPLLNISLISYGVSDLSSTLGEEVEIASIWRLI